jgi:hypothetical protein
VENEEVLDFIDRASCDPDCYLGFITIRPVRSSPVAASILRPLPNQNYLLSSDKFDIHLAGKTFTVQGTPFMQQDNAVGACAQASIWMALRTLRKKEGNSAFDPAQITSAATRFLVRGRTLPNREGLLVEQMIEVIRFAGYSPHLMQFGIGHGNNLSAIELLEAKRKIYSYVESGIPVVLGVYPNSNEGHAIVLIGHKWSENNTPQPCSRSRGVIYNAADWVTSFIAHNDNSGPYMDLHDDSNGHYCLNQLVFAIPLLPSDVFLSGEEAVEVARTLFLSIFNSEKTSINKLVFRTYLIERHQFREWVTGNNNINQSVKRYYRLKILPKRIWVTEINLLDQFNKILNGESSRVGEILIDPTGDPNDAPFLSVHLNISAIVNNSNNMGIIVDRLADTKEINIIPIPRDAIYSTLSRH